MECAAQISGGYFGDPGYKEVPGLARDGFPIAEVGAEGRAVITKLATPAASSASARSRSRCSTRSMIRETRHAGRGRRLQGRRDPRAGERDRVAVGGAGAPRPRGSRSRSRSTRPARRGRHLLCRPWRRGARRARARIVAERIGPARLQRAAPPRSRRHQRAARDAPPGRAARSGTSACARRCAPARASRPSSCCGSRIPALLRPGRRRRLPRPDHALGDHPQRLSAARPGAVPHRDHRDIRRSRGKRCHGHADADRPRRCSAGGEHPEDKARAAASSVADSTSHRTHRDELNVMMSLLGVHAGGDVRWLDAVWAQLVVMSAKLGDMRPNSDPPRDAARGRARPGWRRRQTLEHRGLRYEPRHYEAIKASSRPSA